MNYDIVNPLLDDEEENYDVEEQWDSVKSSTDTNEEVQASTRNPQRKSKAKKELTEQDLETFKFLATVRVCNAQQLAYYLGVKEVYAKKRLAALRSMNFVGSSEITGRRLVYFLLKKGWDHALLTGEIDPEFVVQIRGNELSPAEIGHSLALSQVISQVLSGQEGALGNHSKMPPLSFQALVPDYVMRSQWMSLKENYRRKINNPSLPAASFAQSFIRTVPNDFLVLPARKATLSQLSGSYSHRPDLVLKDLPKLVNGETVPVNVAVEVEVTPKKVSDYVSILGLFMDNPNVYERVIWVVNKEITARNIETAVRKLEKDRGGKLPVKVLTAPLLNFDGTEFSGTPWNIGSGVKW